MKLRDLGLTSKRLIEEAENTGVIISKRRASEIINGQTFIKPYEMKIISKILNKSVDDLYIDLGSVMEVICPIITAGMRKEFICCRQRCALWDCGKQECSIKVNNLHE